MINEHSLSFLKIWEGRLGSKRPGRGAYFRGGFISGFTVTSVYIIRRKNMQKIFCYSIGVRVQNVANKILTSTKALNEKRIRVLHACYRRMCLVG